MDTKVTKYFSRPLMKQSIKSNGMLILAITLVMLMMSTVMTYATSIMGTKNISQEESPSREDFYTYLGAMATCNTALGTELSYHDFITTDNKAAYDQSFAILNAQSETELSAEGLQYTIDALNESDIEIDSLIKQFEYNFVLIQNKGFFSGEDLTMDEMMNTAFEAMGVDVALIEQMGTMDTGATINRMYYTVTGLLPIFLLIVIIANSLIVDQVDRGSMAYILSTPTKRSAVAITQMIFMIVVPFVVLVPVCLSKILATHTFYGDVNTPMIFALFIGMYILVEAVASICYMGSCLFNRSRKSMAFGGGITVWFFLASLLGMFGSDMMVDMGVGVKELGWFNKTTLVGLYDLDSLSTIGTEAVNTDFVWKLGVLLVIAIICYTIGILRFQKKDLPL